MHRSSNGLMFHPRGPTFFELAVQALSSTERGYDLLAPKFDYTPFRTPDEVLEDVIPFLASRGTMDAALDIGCGTGAAMRVLRPLCRRVVGIDFSRGMLAVARERLAQAPGEAEYELVHGNVLDMPFSGEFDLTVCFGALGHILPRDQHRFVDQIARALKPGGRFALLTTGWPSVVSPTYWAARGFNVAMHVRNLLIRPPFIMYYLRFLLPEAQQLLESHGFAVTVYRDVCRGRYAPLQLVVGQRTKGGET